MQTLQKSVKVTAQLKAAAQPLTPARDKKLAANVLPIKPEATAMTMAKLLATSCDCV